eukprot:gene4888-8482_t
MKLIFLVVLVIVALGSAQCVHPCFNRGECSGKECICPSGFGGFDCSLKKCGENFCSAFGGICETPGFRCKCGSQNIVGPSCAYMSCGLGRCFMTGGKCSTGSCTCNPGYQGAYCDQKAQ